MGELPQRRLAGLDRCPGDPILRREREAGRRHRHRARHHRTEACRGGPARIRGTLAGPLPARGRGPGGGTPSPGPGITRRDRPEPHRDRDHVTGRQEVGGARPAGAPGGMHRHRRPRHPAGAPPVARPAAFAARRPRAGGGPALASRSPGPAGRLPGPLRRRPGRHPPRPGPGDRDRRLPDRAGGVDQRRTACPRPAGEDEREVAAPRRGPAPGRLRRRGRVRPGGDAPARGQGRGDRPARHARAGGPARRPGRHPLVPRPGDRGPAVGPHACAEERPSADRSRIASALREGRCAPPFSPGRRWPGRPDEGLGPHSSQSSAGGRSRAEALIRPFGHLLPGEKGSGSASRHSTAEIAASCDRSTGHRTTDRNPGNNRRVWRRDQLSYAGGRM